MTDKAAGGCEERQAGQNSAAVMGGKPGSQSAQQIICVLARFAEKSVFWFGAAAG